MQYCFVSFWCLRARACVCVCMRECVCARVCVCAYACMGVGAWVGVFFKTKTGWVGGGGDVVLSLSLPLYPPPPDAPDFDVYI